MQSETGVSGPQFVNIAGIRVRYIRAGAGPTVLLLHGMMGAISHWEPTVAPLAAGPEGTGGVEVVALDLPPFGESDKPPVVYSLAFYADFLTRFVRELGLERVTLVGHSFGGKVAAYVAAMHPEWVVALVLVASDGFLAQPKRYRAAPVPLMRLFCRVVPPLLPLAQRAFFPRGVAVPPALAADARAFFAHPDAPRALAALSRSERALDLPTSDAAKHLSRLVIPVEIVQGLADRTMAPADAHRAAAIFPHAHLTLLPGVGHVVPIERPAAVVAAVRAAVAARADVTARDPVATFRRTQEDGNQ